MGIAIWLERNTDIPGGLPLVYDPGWGFRLGCVLTLTTGTMFIMWLGEQITERGIGNGMSLIIFAGIVVNLPRAAIATFDQMRTGQMSLLVMAFLVLMMVVVIAAIIYVERGHRRITVQYAKRVVGPAAVRRLEHAHPAEGEHGRRHPGDLRQLDPDLPRHARGDAAGGRLGRRVRRGRSRTACRCTTCST